MEARIASQEMLLNAEPLPHVICSRSGTERGGCDEAIDDGDAEGTDDGTGGALSDCKPKGQGTQGNRVKKRVTRAEMLNLSSPLIRGRGIRWNERTAIRGDWRDDCFSGLFQGFAGPSPAGQGYVSARRDAAAVPARGAGRGGDLRRHRPIRRQEGGASAPLPAVRRRHAVARSSRRHLRHPRRRGNSSAASSPGSPR